MEILRYTAFSNTPDGGNPAGVVLDATGVDAQEMQRVALEVGFSETAFLQPVADASRTYRIRYFSPQAEVSFCGHATIATAVAHAERFGPGEMHLDTASGPVHVATDSGPSGELTATLTSVPPRTRKLPTPTLGELLRSLRWRVEDLHAEHTPAVAYAGAWHPILMAASHERLADLDYDYPALAALMEREGWTTVALVWRESDAVFHVRNPFPPGGVVEDPATGAAAAALGGYLGDRGDLPAGRTFLVHQGAEVGRPSLLTVHVPLVAGAGIQVSGPATVLS